MKDKPKILVGDKIVDEALEMLRAEADVDLKRGIKQPELEEIIENYDALIVRSVPLVTEEVIKRGKKLKVVGRAGNGVDNIDLETATQQGVVVVNTPDSNSFSAGEQTIALMLASAGTFPRPTKLSKKVVGDGAAIWAASSMEKRWGSWGWEGSAPLWLPVSRLSRCG